MNGHAYTRWFWALMGHALAALLASGYVVGRLGADAGAGWPCVAVVAVVVIVCAVRLEVKTARLEGQIDASQESH